jgi:hypothetical protein
VQRNRSRERVLTRTKSYLELLHVFKLELNENILSERIFEFILSSIRKEGFTPEFKEKWQY